MVGEVTLISYNRVNPPLISTLLLSHSLDYATRSLLLHNVNKYFSQPVRHCQRTFVPPPS